VDAEAEGDVAIVDSPQVEAVRLGELGGIGLAAPITVTTMAPLSIARPPISTSTVAKRAVRCTPS
jgi:hypothetical protein